jgi:hypothetical protein
MPVNILYENWQSSGSVWVNNQNVINQYNAQNQLVESLLQGWNAGSSAWEDLTKNTSTYDTAGNLILVLQEAWSQALQLWEPDLKSVYQYNQDGSINYSLIQTWDNVLGLWDNNSDVFYHYSCSLPLSVVSPEGQQQDIKLYPNPSRDKISIDFSGKGYAAQHISLVDISGREAERFFYDSKESKAEINISHLTSGMYLLKMLDQNQQPKIIKVIKQD